jgi:hypothetical protein
LLDEGTISQLESRCPRYCQQDSKEVDLLMRNRKIFPAVQDDSRRREILINLNKFTYLIPSLSVIQNNCRYLKPCAEIMQRLFEYPKQSCKTTIREAAIEAFSGINQSKGIIKLQTSETNWRLCHGNEQFEFGFQQVYLGSMREVFKITRHCPLKEPGEPTPVQAIPDPKRWYELAKLAYNLGFESPEIERRIGLDPDKEKARDILRAANEDEIDETVDKIAQILKSSKETTSSDRGPNMLIDGPGESMTRRCGRHFSKAYEYDRRFLFLELLNQPIDGNGTSISSLFVRRSVYFSFFRTLESELEHRANSERDIEMLSDSGMLYPEPAARPKSPEDETILDVGELIADEGPHNGILFREPAAGPKSPEDETIVDVGSNQEISIVDNTDTDRPLPEVRKRRPRSASPKPTEYRRQRSPHQGQDKQLSSLGPADRHKVGVEPLLVTC